MISRGSLPRVFACVLLGRIVLRRGCCPHPTPLAWLHRRFRANGWVVDLRRRRPRPIWSRRSRGAPASPTRNRAGSVCPTPTPTRTLTVAPPSCQSSLEPALPSGGPRPCHRFPYDWPRLRFSWTILLQLPEQRTMPGTSTSSIVAPEPSDLQGQPDSPGGAQKRKRDDGAALASHPPEFAVPLPPMTAALLSRSLAPDGSPIAQPPPGSQPRVEVVDCPGARERGQRSSDTDGGSSSGAVPSGDNAPSSSNPLTALPLTGCLTE